MHAQKHGAMPPPCKVDGPFGSLRDLKCSKPCVNIFFRSSWVQMWSLFVCPLAHNFERTCDQNPNSDQKKYNPHLIFCTLRLEENLQDLSSLHQWPGFKAVTPIRMKKILQPKISFVTLYVLTHLCIPVCTHPCIHMPGHMSFIDVP